MERRAHMTPFPADRAVSEVEPPLDCNANLYPSIKGHAHMPHVIAHDHTMVKVSAPQASRPHDPGGFPDTKEADCIFVRDEDAACHEPSLKSGMLREVTSDLNLTVHLEHGGCSPCVAREEAPVPPRFEAQHQPYELVA